MNTIVLATRNQGKIAELSQPFGELGYEVRGLGDFPSIGEVEETGNTFAENALLKARAVAAATGLIAIADDSGIVVDALGGAPGIYSARYGDDWEAIEGESRDARNIRKLLHAMRKVPDGQRQACFKTVIAASSPEGEYLLAEGEWPGIVIASPLGTDGFGYDPVFWDPRLGKTAAQLKKEEKNAVSHRGQAVNALIQAWPEFVERLKKGRNGRVEE